jgi:general secretion pathway protein C
MNAVRSWLDAMAANGRWQDALQSRVPQAAVWVLAVVLGVQAAIFVTRWAGAGSPTPSPAEQPTGVARAPIDVAAITGAHLFGAAPGAAATGEGAPATRIPLVLTGTLAAKRPDEGIAILGPNPGAVKVYAVGDTVPGGAHLHAVYDDRVLLEYDGHLESLALLRERLGRGGLPSLGTGTAPVERAVERVRRLMTDNPGVLETVIRPQPVFAGGKLAGYRVYPGSHVQAFTSLGLRAGDLVTAIDGTPLDDPSRSEEIFRTLGSSSEARVTVVRNGRKQDLDLNLARVASEADRLTNGGNGAGGASQPNRLGRVP